LTSNNQAAIPEPPTKGPRVTSPPRPPKTPPLVRALKPLSARVPCPTCKSQRTNKDGTPNGIQRHKCIECGKRWFENGQAVLPQPNSKSPKPTPLRLEHPKPTNVPKTISTPRADSIPQPPTEDIHRDAVRQYKLELQPSATTDLYLRITKQLELLAQARQLAISLGEQPLHLFTQALEENIKPITAVVHNAVAIALGYPTIPIDPPVPQVRDPADGPPSSSVDHAAFKKRLLALERANHDLRRESNVLNNQMIESTAARQRIESHCRILTEERDDLKILATELEQSRKSLKAELLEVRQKQNSLAVEIRQEQTVDRKPPPVPPEDATLNREPTPRTSGGQSSSTRIGPPTLTVAERQEIERMASTLMATLGRLEGHKIRSSDISSVTGIATGWKRTIEHLIGLGKVMYHNEFLCISYAEKIRRGLK
jgi:hypothetical protein